MITINSMTPMSKALYTLSNNDMLNASFVDFFAMDTPRTFVEFKHRGKNAGIEMGFREYTGTFIAEFSAAVFALFISKIASKFYKPETKVNPSSWVTNKGLDVFSNIYEQSDKTPKGFIEDTLNSMKGLKNNFSNLSKETKEPIVEKLVEIITNNNLNKKEVKKGLENVQNEIISVLKSDNNIQIKEYSSNLTHTLRDIADLGKNVFFKEGIDYKDAIKKLKTLNKSRIAFAIPASILLAITNQYINRRITKARTGIDNFVGENGYEENVKDKNEHKKQKGLLAKKMLSAGIFLFMLSKVMGIKKPADIINKLEFDGPATSGNAIKTIYGTLILGRIFASKDSTELRETNVRDYLGFLNWLVFGGFVAKGVAQIFDPKKQNLFNITKEGKGIKHWLNDISLKSQKEIIAQGKDVSKNLRKLNIASLSGILYSAIMLGIFLPKLNIYMTKHTGKNKTKPTNATAFMGKNISFDEFRKNLAKNK